MVRKVVKKIKLASTAAPLAGLLRRRGTSSAANICSTGRSSCTESSLRSVPAAWLNIWRFDQSVKDMSDTRNLTGSKHQMLSRLLCTSQRTLVPHFVPNRLRESPVALLGWGLCGVAKVRCIRVAVVQFAAADAVTTA